MTSMRSPETELRIFSQQVENDPGFFVSTCPQTKIIQSCNAALSLSLGYGSPTELIGRPIRDIYDPECHPLFHYYYQMWLKNGRFEGLGLRLKSKNGTVIPIYVQVDSIRDELGQIRYSKVHYRPTEWFTDSLYGSTHRLRIAGDAAASYETNQSLANEYLERLNHNLSLCSINAQLIQQQFGQYNQIESQEGSFEVSINQILQKALALEKAVSITQALVMSSNPLTKNIESDGICKPEFQLQQSMEIIRSKFKQKDIGIQSQIKNLEIEIPLSTLAFLQIVFNLFAIAFEFCSRTPACPLVVVESSILNGYFQIRVGNLGPPLAKAEEINLFSPFFTTKDCASLGGMEMFVIQDILKKIGGSVAYSQYNGQACLDVRIPIKV